MILTAEQRTNMEGLIEDLKSGKYAKGSGMLRDKNDRYCCLGVLCQRHDPEGWVVSGLDSEAWGHRPEFPLTVYTSDTTYPKSELSELYGFATKEGALCNTDGLQIKLYVGDNANAHLNIGHVNDSYDTFDQVIAILESYLADQTVTSIRVPDDTNNLRSTI